MSKIMKRITFFSLMITLFTTIIYLTFKISLFKTLAITFATTFYHFAMRLLVGMYYQRKYANNISWKNKWFNTGKIERKIYKTIKVNRWKKYIPTYNSSFFDINTCSYEQIAMAMCQAELVHETIIVFSFLPIMAYKWFGSIEVFIITSIISAFIDLIFVILQRYNRPRILRFIH
ncbi:MAG: hypothetical protein R3Y09_09170 [Clostridia bacterium]